MKSPFWRVLLPVILGWLATSFTGTSGEMLVQYASVWKYQMFTNDPGTAWRETHCDDGAWLSGLGIFGAPMDEPLPAAAVQDGATLNTPLPQQPGREDFYPAYYFRGKFTFAGPATHVLLTFSNVVDDGAVFYLNGEELGPRLGMNPGPVSMTNFANRVVEVRTTGVEVFHVVPTNLLTGTNLLSVELHNSSPVNHDVIFGLNLSWERLPVLNIRPEPNAVTLWWETSRPFVLEQAAHLEQSWTEVQPGGNPCKVSITNGPSRFFRLRLAQTQP